MVYHDRDGLQMPPTKQVVVSAVMMSRVLFEEVEVVLVVELPINMCQM